MQNTKIKIVDLKVEDLKPYEKNAKKHNQDQIDNVAKSIKKYGFVQPLVIDKDNVVIIGHCRLEASKKLNLKEVPCVRADSLTEDQVKELRLLDNKLNESDWDMELLGDELVDLDLGDFEIDWNLPNDDIDWDSVQDLDDKSYDEPKHNMLECPFCHHIDRDIHFKKVEGVADDIKTEDN